MDKNPEASVAEAKWARMREPRNEAGEENARRSCRTLSAPGKSSGLSLTDLEASGGV